MPIYEYECLECDTRFEHLQSFSAHGHPPCPNCGSMHVSRLMSKPAIHFKGTGWYITDSKNSSRQSANGESPDRGEKISDESPSTVNGDSATKGPEKSPASSSEKSGAEKAGADKPSSEKSGAEKSGAERPGEKGSSGSTASASAPASS